MADKWYRFTPKPKHRILTAEEAEELVCICSVIIIGIVIINHYNVG
jgi:hypothetical protein